ncbi:hypothetical protein [Bacillus atrophaeus]|uniref:hypothetical protein n=1 Tax=Bacillus atrophaeus TaxID=1452 RepID=UPI00077AA7ED|nr:hypothetical protein [Bacillus atrophaeus]KXZ13252.1 hypothetical protein AXI57_15980 [Bacillus atrophaeus]MED4806342.1 hypothetical protein [Bacillus atrophaeus]UFD97632.1 hypothetical protein [Bacillus atrophaeus]GED04218.1 hypothetical protein BAT02nite_38620 [Bacillus atrophaeus]
MNEILFNIFAVLSCIFCLLSLFKKFERVFISIGAIFLIMAFSTGGFGDALHSWLSTVFGFVDQDEQNQILTVMKTFRIHFYIILFFGILGVFIKLFFRHKRNNSSVREEE